MEKFQQRFEKLPDEAKVPSDEDEEQEDEEDEFGGVAPGALVMKGAHGDGGGRAARRRSTKALAIEAGASERQGEGGGGLVMVPISEEGGASAAAEEGGVAVESAEGQTLDVVDGGSAAAAATVSGAPGGSGGAVVRRRSSATSSSSHGRPRSRGHRRPGTGGSSSSSRSQEDFRLPGPKLPPLPQLIRADGKASANPLDELYTVEERQLLGLLVHRNPEVRLKPVEHEEGWSFDADQDEGWRWDQDPTWVVAASEGATNRGALEGGEEPNLPKNIFNGDRTSQWTPNSSLRGGGHWLVVDFRTLKVIDAFRIMSDASTKHTVKGFRVEVGPSQAGPWALLDNYMYKNTDIKNGSVETWMGFEATTRYVRIFIESSVSEYAPALQYASFRFAPPTLTFSNQRLALNPESRHGRPPVVRLVLRGTHFSQVVADNKVVLVPIDVTPPDEQSKAVAPNGTFKARLQPNTYAGDNIKMDAPVATVVAASPCALVLEVKGLQLMHAGAIGAIVTVGVSVSTRVVQQVCEVFEEVRDPFEYVKEAAATSHERLCDALKAHPEKAMVQYWGIRAIIKFPTCLDEDGTPPEETFNSIERVLDAMTAHETVVPIQAWGANALANLAEEHGNRIAMMGFEWLERLQDAMLTLISGNYDEESNTVVVPEDALELAQYGCKLLCYMAYEEKSRDYVAGQGIPAVIKAMTECETDVLTQAYGCEALFNFVFRCEPAWTQCQEIGAPDVVEAALELNKRDDYLMKRALNAQKALGPEGWLGRALIRDLKLGEAREMVAKQKARERRAAARKGK